MLFFWSCHHLSVWGFFGRSPPQSFIGALRLLSVFELSVLRFGVLGFGGLVFS